ncbi:MAG: BTAD domain-containing putative transcriptional regulator, partial [Longimicrobiales bacterium]
MIRVQVLGRLALEARGEPVHALAAQPLRGSVFLYLCVEREAKRETLVRMFWPDREEDKARRLLSQTLYELKRLVSEDWCSAAGEVVRVEHVTVDAHGFDGAVARQESDRALAYYQGRFLADFQRFDSAEFNAWVDRKAAYYERLHRRTRRERIKQQLQEGDRSGALAVAQRWSELDPLEDEAQHRTIELLHELGRRTEALQSYETYLARLKEVELVPLDDTRLLAARVRESPEPKGAVGVSTVPLPAEPVSAPARLDAAPAAKAWYRRRRVRAGVAVGLLATFAAALVMLLSPEDEVRSAVLPIDSAGSDLSRIAVLYFDDHSAGGTLDYLAKGLTEALIEELSRVEALNVISRNGVKPFQNANATIDSIRRALKVGTIVEGSVQQAGDSIRVGVDLVDARTGVRVDSRTLQAAIGKGFELEDDVVREVGVFLRERLGREIQLQRIARGASSQEAYRLYQTADDFREQVLAAQPRLRVSDSDRYEFLLQSADSMLIAASRLDPRWLEPVLLRGWLAYDRGVRVSTPDGEEPARYMRAAIR